MYYLNKIVGFCTSPAGVAFSLFLLAAVSCSLKRCRLSRILIVFCAVWLWVWMMPFTIRFVGATLEDMTGKACINDFTSIPKAEAAVLLGGSCGVHNRCGAAEMFFSADRVRTAASLWKAGRVKKIIITGPNASRSMLPILVDFGVDSAACISLEQARNTEEEALAVSKVAGKRIILVTSAWHMPRAKLLFERQGFDVCVCPADFEMRAAAESPLKFSDFIPSGDAFLRNSYALKEWVALIGYKLFR